ncbi:MAG: NAD-dependent epimerase/dehydratase family protein [Rhodocyclaceae bacterium]|nr:NAD-dependent epimerase/dehydratase family protein [Rhodocyclaceae bacterium]
MVQVASYANVPDGDLLIHLAEEPDRAVASRAGDAYVEESTGLARALSRRFAGRMIYASSGVVYGDAGQAPFRVGDPLVPTDAYARAKILGEAAVLEEGGTVVRLANLFGPRMSKGNVMSDILHQIPGDGPVLVRDDMPVRDFLAVDDAAKLFTLLAGSRINGALNAGSGVGTRIRHCGNRACAVRRDRARDRRDAARIALFGQRLGRERDGEGT